MLITYLENFYLIKGLIYLNLRLLNGLECNISKVLVISIFYML